MTEERLITFIDFIRHGEPEGGNKFRGNMDDPLSEEGRQQMDEAIGDFRDWDIIATSPLKRCAEYAQDIGRHSGIEVELWDDFAEISFGEWEGKTASEVDEEKHNSVSDFIQDPVHNMPPGAENFVEYQERVLAAWDGFIEQHAGKKILIVGHGGFIRVILSKLLDIPLTNIFRIEIPFASISRVSIEKIDDFTISSVKCINGKF